MSKKIVVPNQDATYLHANYKTMSVPAMAKILKRANATVYGYMTALKLKPKEYKPATHHPFKRQNRKLETMFLGRRIHNGQLKKEGKCQP